MDECKAGMTEAAGDHPDPDRCAHTGVRATAALWQPPVPCTLPSRALPPLPALCDRILRLRKDHLHHALWRRGLGAAAHLLPCKGLSASYLSAGLDGDHIASWLTACGQDQELKLVLPLSRPALCPGRASMQARCCPMAATLGLARPASIPAAEYRRVGTPAQAQSATSRPHHPSLTLHRQQHPPLATCQPLGTPGLQQTQTPHRQR